MPEELPFGARAGILLYHVLRRLKARHKLFLADPNSVADHAEYIRGVLDGIEMDVRELRRLLPNMCIVCMPPRHDKVNGDRGWQILGVVTVWRELVWLLTDGKEPSFEADRWDPYRLWWLVQYLAIIMSGEIVRPPPLGES